MSLNHDRYLLRLPSLTRQVAIFHSASIQDQVDTIRTDLNELIEVVKDLIDRYRHDHQDINNNANMVDLDTADTEVMPPDQQVAERRDFPYL
ncbi:MAG TPA: hypothetical protein VFJ05_06945 [Nitrososphaeraceae archaeon]|nr:hypothetical protein [Nitrososphaeraceae archaeon]